MKSNINSIGEKAKKAIQKKINSNTKNNVLKSFLFLINKEKEKIILENKPNKYFRITVHGGGCSGFKYKFSFDSKKNSI